MNWKLCMETPAGERYYDDIETAELQEHVLHAPLRTGFSDAMVWVDGHTNWQSGTPIVKPPIKGDGNWQFFFHDAEKKCPLCPPAPEQHQKQEQAAPAHAKMQSKSHAKA